MPSLARLLLLAVLLAALTSMPRADEPSGPPSILDLYKNGKLFDKTAYKAVRGAFARDFETRHDTTIKGIFGNDHADLMAWFEKQVDLKEDLFTAIDEKHDRIPVVLGIFRDLWKKSPEQVARYPALAIACSVTWDTPRSVYDYEHHQRRTKSTLPEEMHKIGPLENFQYFVEHAKKLQGPEPIERVLLMPWEFLTYVVNNKTPIEEREWAIKGYLLKRPMIGKVYAEIEYDKEMLRTNSQVCRLKGEPYTLESIRRKGGVCAMQGDFAARVAQSLAVPAAYVTGQAATLDLHAWVMWVEVTSITKTSISFQLMSHGRYGDDHYFTGDLVDPHTGEKITDRDMERRLGVVALDRIAARQSLLAMRALSQVREAENLDLKQRVAYLDRVLKLSPYSEEAWKEMAAMVKAGDLQAEQRAIVAEHQQTLLKTFNNYPDFVWQIADELVKVHADRKQQCTVLAQMITKFEGAKRPDLAAVARLEWADLQVEEQAFRAAADGVAQTVAKFPEEGRYVPKMMTKLIDICGKFKGGEELLSKFYLGFLDRVPPKRGDAPSEYCIKLHEDALAFFKTQKNDKVVAALEQKLIKLRGK
jgi:hypothetical protein